MISLRRRLLLLGLKLSDALSLPISFAAVAVLLSPSSATAWLRDIDSLRISVGEILAVLWLLLAWHLCFVGTGLYHSGRLSNLQEEVIRVVRATFLGAAILLATAVVLEIQTVTSSFTAVFWGISTILVVCQRTVLRYVLRFLRRHGRNLRHVMVVGTNERAVRFAQKIQAEAELGYRLVGFVENGWQGNPAFAESGYSVVADFDSLPDFLRNNVVDEVVICLPVKSFYGRIATMIALCEQQGIVARLLSDFFGVKKAVARAETFEGDPIITIKTGRMAGIPYAIKRAMDFALSLVMLLALSPLLVVIAVLVRISSRGPIFFAQDRVGLNGRVFRLYKFRTMICGAEKRRFELERLNEVSGPVFKIRNDPRVTPIGKVLRQTSIDELPQLFNVLKGDMSLVGPRPLPVYECERFDQARHRRRFSVRPGLTCLWQVNGRNEVPFEKWMELDMQYIDQWSLWLDLKLLAWTIPAVLRKTGS